MSSRARIVALVLLVVLASCVAAGAAVAAPKGGGGTAKAAVVSGTVRSSTGAPLGGANVTFSTLDKRGSLVTVASTLTDSAGRYQVTLTRTGSFTAQFAASQYKPSQATIDITAYKPYTLDATLEPVVPPNGTISGTIHWGVSPHWTPSGSASATVIFYRVNPDGSYSAQAARTVNASSGVAAYVSPQLPLGDYKVRFTSRGFVDEYFIHSSQIASAVVVSLTSAGQAVNGVDCFFQSADCYSCHPAGRPAYGRITGNVYWNIDKHWAGFPEDYAVVSFYRMKSDGSWPAQPDATLDVQGVGGSIWNPPYASPLLLEGTYKVKFSSPEYVDDYFNDVDTFAQAATVRITSDGQTVAGVDGHLDDFDCASCHNPSINGSLSGRITWNTAVHWQSTMPSGTTVDIYRQAVDGSWPTAPLATVTVGGFNWWFSPTLPLGNYKVRFKAPGYLPRYYNQAAGAATATVLSLQPYDFQISDVHCYLDQFDCASCHPVGPEPPTIGMLAGTFQFTGDPAIPGFEHYGRVEVLRVTAGGSVEPTPAAMVPLVGGAGGLVPWTSPALTPGTYKIRFSETGCVSTYYDHAMTIEAARPLTIDASHMQIYGVNGGAIATATPIPTGAVF